MAEEEKDKENPEEAPPPKKSKKPLIIALSVVGLLIVIGAPATYMVIKHNAKPVDEVGADAAKLAEEAVPEANAEEDELEEEEKPLGALHPMDTFVVNISGGRYIRTQLQVEFTEREIPKRFYIRIVLVRDAIIGLLLQKNAEDLLSPKGKDNLRAEIKDTINEILHREEVKNVYFTQYVVQ